MKEIALLGPTASGKSSLAIEIAKEIGANILSLDSLSIYSKTYSFRKRRYQTLWYR